MSMDADARNPGPVPAAASATAVPSAMQSFIPPKRPVRINGRLSLPAELWPAVITAAVRDYHGIVLFDARCPDLPGVTKRTFQDVIAELLAPLEEIPIAKREAEQDVWAVNEFVFQVSCRHELRTSVHCWDTTLLPFRGQIGHLHFLLHDGDSARWHHDTVARYDLFGTYLPPDDHIQQLVRRSMVDPVMAIWYAATSCQHLSSLTIQLLNTPIRRGPRSRPTHRLELLSKKIKQLLTFLRNTKMLMRIERVIFAVLSVDEVHGTQSIALRPHEVLKEGEGNLAGLDDEALYSTLANRFYTSIGGRPTSRVAMQLA